MSTNYDRGSVGERKVKKHLESLGWIVTKAAGSKGKWDLVALRGDETKCDALLIQCRLTGNMSRREWCELASVADDAGARPLLCKPMPGKQEPQFYEHDSHRWVSVEVSGEA